MFGKTRGISKALLVNESPCFTEKDIFLFCHGRSIGAEKEERIQQEQKKIAAQQAETPIDEIIGKIVTGALPLRISLLYIR